MSLNDYISVAKQCGIIERDDAIKSLSILDKKMMAVRVFKTEWDTLVVVKPKVLSKKVSLVLKHIVIMHHTSYPVIQYKELENISLARASEKVEEHIETATFIKILLHLSIIAPNQSGLETQYIVPSMLPHALPTAMTGIMVANDAILSIADDKKLILSNELLFSFESFKFRIPSTLHSLVLCALMQDTQWIVNMQECSKICALFSTRENDFATFQLTIFKEGISLSLRKKGDWKESTEIVQYCMKAKYAVLRALQGALTLVEYGAPLVTCYNFQCLKQNCSIQDDGLLIDHDCMTSHSIPDNVWFSKVRQL